MKANETPEKIYIDVSLDSAWGMTERSCDNEVEYIRTDAFIEKACNVYCNTCGNSRCRGIGCAKLSTFKEQLNNRL